MILGQAGPKVIDFGIAQALDATSMTRTGMMVGSAGFMAPEQVTGRAGQAADIFAWAVTLTYAASGEMPFGTGSSDAILYRILHTEPDISAVPELLRPLVEAALVKDPQRRPRADELLAQLTNRSRADRDYEFNTQAVLAQTWPVTEATPVVPPTSGSLLLEPGPPRARRPRRGVVNRRTATVGGPVLVVLARASSRGWAMSPSTSRSRCPSARPTSAPSTGRSSAAYPRPWIASSPRGTRSSRWARRPATASSASSSSSPPTAASPGAWPPCTPRAEARLRWPEDVHGMLAATGLELELLRGSDPAGGLEDSPTYFVLAEPVRLLPPAAGRPNKRGASRV